MLLRVPRPAQFPNRIFGIAVELPDQFSSFRFEGIDPAIAAGKNNLGFAVDYPVGWVRPLTV